LNGKLCSPADLYVCLCLGNSRVLIFRREPTFQIGVQNRAPSVSSAAAGCSFLLTEPPNPLSTGPSTPASKSPTRATFSGPSEVEKRFSKMLQPFLALREASPSRRGNVF
jgi:hypothetical protein